MNLGPVAPGKTTCAPSPLRHFCCVVYLRGSYCMSAYVCVCVCMCLSACVCARTNKKLVIQCS